MFSVDRILLAVSVTALLFVCFMAGGVASYYHYFPYSWVRDAGNAKKAVSRQNKVAEQAKNEKFIPNKDEQPVRSASEAASEGYTIYTLYKRPGAVMVDKTGKEVYRWDMNAEESKNGKLPVHWRDFYAYDNGDLLVIEEVKGETPYGRGLRRIDKDGRTIWYYAGGNNHLIDVTRDGTIYGLCHKLSEGAGFGPNMPKGKVLEDFLCVVDKDGKELKHLSLNRMLLDAGFAEAMRRPAGDKKWDMVHANSAMLLTPEMATKFPMFKAGQVLVSLRSLNMLVMIDLELEKVVWSSRGIWKMQHDATFMPNGTILIYDNRGMTGQRSRLLSLNPEKNETKIIYGGKAEQQFYSGIMGSVEPLMGDRYLLSEMDTGHIFEIDENGALMWDFYTPYYSTLGGRARVMAAHRYSGDYFTFLTDELKSQAQQRYEAEQQALDEKLLQSTPKPVDEEWYEEKNSKSKGKPKKK